MSLFDKLLVTHLVGDFLLQTEWQATNKARNFWAMSSHIAVYSIIMLVVLFADFGFQNATVYLMVCILGVSHAFIDLRWPVIRFMKAFRLVVTREPMPWLVLTVDQCFHILIIAFVVLVLSP